LSEILYEVYDCYVTKGQLDLFNQIKLEGVEALNYKRSNARRYNHHQKSVDLSVAYELYKIYLKEGE
jgi:hypothetical protein